MVADTVIIPSDFAQGALSAVVAISAALARLLAMHGEPMFIAGVAHAIGLGRILDVAAQSNLRIVCDAVADGNTKAQHGIERSDAPVARDRGTTITYYVAGCEGAKKLARLLNRPVFKIGYTCQDIPAKRLNGLDRIAYGGWEAAHALLHTAKPLEGWSVWEFARYEPTDTAHVILPNGVRVENGLWRVDLPPGADPQDFDRIVTAAMTARQLAFWAMSGEGRTHCKQHGFDPQECVRFARDERTGVLRPVEEIYAYSPRRDAGWFATILGEALAHVRRSAVAI